MCKMGPCRPRIESNVPSPMNIIKSNIRNKMGDKFLTDCLVYYIEKELFTTIDNEVIL